VSDVLDGPDPRLHNRVIIVVISAGVLLALIVGWNLFKNHMIQQAMSQNSSPPQTVTAANVAYSSWQPTIDAVGSLRAVRGVDVTTEVTGLVRSIQFHSGEDAKAGQILVELNADVEIGALQSLQAAAELAATVLARDRIQFDAQAISQAQIDADVADLKNKRAQVVAQEAAVAKRTLRAPFAGRLGITTVNPGQYLNAGDKVVTLQAIDTLYVDARLPQQQLARVHTGQGVTLTVDAFPGESFTGTLTALDSQVDPATRNFEIEASIENPHRRLMPGMFGRVAIAAGTVTRFLTLPQTAISYNPYGATVFLARRGAGAKAGLTAQQVFVTLGATRGDQVAIVSGVNEGDLVVTSGQLKIKNGTPLEVDNSVQPKNDAGPTPQEN